MAAVTAMVTSAKRWLARAGAGGSAGWSRDHAEMPQQAGDAGEHGVDGRALPMLSGLHQAGASMAWSASANRGIVDQAPAAGMAVIGDDQLGTPTPNARSRPFGDVPHRISGSDGHSIECRSSSTSTRVDQRADLARAVEFDRMARAVQHGRVPHAVDVLVDEARCGGLARIEAFERGEIDEAEGQPAARRRKAGRAAAGRARWRRRSRCHASAPAARHAARAAPTRAW